MTLGRSQGQREERAGDRLWGHVGQRWGPEERKWMKSLRETRVEGECLIFGKTPN